MDGMNAVPSRRDVVGGHALLRVAIRAFTLLDGFPSLFERREIPSCTAHTHGPQPSTLGVEREAAANGKVLDALIRAEGGVAEETGGVLLLPAARHKSDGETRTAIQSQQLPVARAVAPVRHLVVTDFVGLSPLTLHEGEPRSVARINHRIATATARLRLGQRTAQRNRSDHEVVGRVRCGP